MRLTFTWGLLALCLHTMAAPDTTLLVGTYTHQGSHGIYVVQFDPATGALSLKDSIAAANPSYLKTSNGGSKIYALEETTEGFASIFDLNTSTGQGKLVHRESTIGSHPCHIDVHNSGKWMAVANYTGGSLNVFPIVNGVLQDATQIIQYPGKGEHPTRQTKSHVHQSLFSPDGKYLWVTDLGLDRVTRYPFNPKREKPADPAQALEIKLPSMTGPRHIAIHPKLPIVYVLGELDGTIRVVEHQKKHYSIEQAIRSDTVSAEPGSAHILLSPDNKFLYVSHRAQANLISIYEVHPKAGVIRPVGAVSSGGVAPRNFTLHPSGKWLLVANQLTNNIVVMARDPMTGLLEPTEHVLELSQPVCLQFAQ